MLTKDVEVGKRYLTRDGKEVLTKNWAYWGIGKYKERMYTVEFVYGGQLRCVFANGKGRGTTQLDGMDAPYILVEELDDYVQVQLSLFEE